MKDMTPDQLNRMEKSEGEGIQSAMYSWFLERGKRGTLSIKVQDPSTTNVKLINYNKAVAGTIGSSTGDLINTLMRKISRRIPYTKK